MSSWRCPHCGAAQPETARCWVCQRSTTCCATCRHFRRGVAAGLGFCGLDRRRAPLIGDEMRVCWEGSIVPLLDQTEPFAVPHAGPADHRPQIARPALVFVEVPSGAVPARGPATTQEPSPAAIAAPRATPPQPDQLDDTPLLPPRRPDPPRLPLMPFVTGWTLWGDAFL